MNLFRQTYDFFYELFSKRRVIFHLVKSDFQNRYTGSFLGFLWAVIQPMVMTFIFWFVFGHMWGPMEGPGGEPFLSYFIVGFVAWNFFVEALVSTTTVFVEYSFLVKKVCFKISVLPLVKILSSLVFHGIFLYLAVIMILINGATVSFYWFQTLYYIFALTCLVLGLGWLASSLHVFIKDVAQAVMVAVQFGFWLTPIIWNINMVPPDLLFFLKLNPMLYIVDGYRKCLLYNQPFWHDLTGLFCFWGLTVFIMLVGIVVFKKLKPHFADVL